MAAQRAIVAGSLRLLRWLHGAGSTRLAIAPLRPPHRQYPARTLWLPGSRRLSSAMVIGREGSRLLRLRRYPCLLATLRPSYVGHTERRTRILRSRRLFQG